MVTDGAHADTGSSMTSRPLLPRWTRPVHETSKGRVAAHGNQAASRLTQKATFSVVHDRDDHRVSARIMLPAAATLFPGGTPAHLPSPRHVGCTATDCAESVASMPAQLGPGLGHDARIRAAQVFCRGASVFKSQAAAFQLVRSTEDKSTASRDTRYQAEEDRIGSTPSGADRQRSTTPRSVRRYRNVQLPQAAFAGTGSLAWQRAIFRRASPLAAIGGLPRIRGNAFRVFHS